MNKKLMLIVLLSVTLAFAGCISENNPIEYEIIKVNMVEDTDDDALNQYDFDIIYITSEGYIKYMSTSKRDLDNLIRLKQSDSNEYRLFRIHNGHFYDEFELHIPKNVMLDLKSEVKIV